MKPSTLLAQRAWQQASIRGREYAESKLAERSPVTVPTGSFFRFLSDLPQLPAPLVVFGIVFAGIGCLLVARFGLPF